VVLAYGLEASYLWEIGCMVCRRSLPALLLAAALACCSGAPPARPDAASVASVASVGARPHRVVLILLDGGSTRTLHDLYRQGVLDKGGFARFFREGEVADALVPAAPSLSTTNHVTLATGFPPAATGIVGTRFHPGGTPFAHEENGFDAAIGTETLWEAARRQGKRVGIPFWPGIDTRGERRTADWGLTLNPARDPQVFDLARADWRPVQPGPMPEGVVSHSRLLTTQVTVPADVGVPAQTLELFAVDGKDDGRTAYDGLAVIGPPYSVGRRAAPPLRTGEWRLLTWPRADGRSSSSLKLLALSPDLSHARLFVGGLYDTIAYPSGFAGSFAGSGIYWPGPASNNSLAASWEGKTGIDLATWTEQADRLSPFFADALRIATAREDWDLLMCSIAIIDQAGHALTLLDPRQPHFSPALRDDLARARSRVWQAVDRQLGQLLAGLDLARTTVVVVGDHGMMAAHTGVDPNAPLAELGLLPRKTAGGGSPSGPVVYAIGNGGVAHIYIDNGGDAAAGARTLDDLARRYADWRVAGEAPIERIFRRQEAAQIGLDSPNSGDLILFAREGYVLRNLPGGKPIGPAPVYGVHGYLSSHPEMLALYMAIGAGVRPGHGGTLQATEVAPRVAKWLGIDPPRREINR